MMASHENALKKTFNTNAGRWKKHDAKRFVKYEHVIRNVFFNSKSNNFSVIIYDIKNDTTNPPKEFDYVVNATGHFSCPNIPEFKGIEKFPGRVFHAHDFRNGEEFAGLRLLVIGASYSAEDIALQCQKFGAKRIVCSYRSSPLGYKWPENIRERPLLVEIQGSKCIFLDGESEEFDVIIMATGYIHNYPWMNDDLRISNKEPNSYFVNNLYKGVLWLDGAANKLLYIGSQAQLYTFTLFDSQAYWIVKYLAGLISLPSKEAMMEDSQTWRERSERNIHSFEDELDFQLSYMQDINKDADYPYNLDCQEIYLGCRKHKLENVFTYRDKQFKSIHTSTLSPLHHTEWMKAFDDSLETFLKT